MASNNDCGVREFDVERFQLINHFRFPWPVNVSLYIVLGFANQLVLVLSANEKHRRIIHSLTEPFGILLLISYARSIHLLVQTANLLLLWEITVMDCW